MAETIDIVNRLRGIYRIPITDGLGPAGGEEPDNPNEFVRRFETPPIQREAADHIEQQAAEIERLRAGGCARDQGLTQYCAEAAGLAAENAKLLDVYAHARGLCYGTDWNNGTAARFHRAKLTRAVNAVAPLPPAPDTKE